MAPKLNVAREECPEFTVFPDAVVDDRKLMFCSLCRPRIGEPTRECDSRELTPLRDDGMSL